MNFDTVFDYSPIVIGVSTQINELNRQMTEASEKVNMLTTSPYADLFPNEIAVFNNIISVANQSIIGYQAILDEITRLNTLPTQDKDLIYYFYTILDVPKNKYMIKLLFNSDKISNPNVMTVYNDNTTNSSTKLLTAQLLYNQFSINVSYPEIMNIDMYL